jgi:hypothetical protein
MTARKHHHVSQFYLEGFTGPVAGYRRSMLFVIDGKENRSFLASPKDVAFKKDFHRIEVDGYRPDALETAFGHAEGKLSQALKRIINNRSSQDADDRACLFEFMALLAVKNPRHRENFRQFNEEVTKRINLATATPERWAAEMRRTKIGDAINSEDYAKLRQFVEAEQYNVTMPTNLHLALELQALDAVLPFFFQRKWVLFRAPPRQTGFITSDNPLCLMWSDPAQRGDFKGPGHGRRGTLVIFPISNELAIIGAFEASEEERDASASSIAKINGTIALHADRQIYARDTGFTYQMAHNEKIMQGDKFLADQESL